MIDELESTDTDELLDDEQQKGLRHPYRRPLVGGSHVDVLDGNKAKQRMNEGLYRGRFAFNEGRPASSGARARCARRAGAPLRHEGQHAPMGNLLSGAVNYWG